MRVYLVSLDGFKTARTFYLGEFDAPQDAIRLFFRRRGVAVSSVSRPSITGSYADEFEAYVEYAATASVYLHQVNEDLPRLVDVPCRVRNLTKRPTAQNAPESTNAAQHEPT